MDQPAKLQIAKPKKSLGQNFLIDTRIRHRITDAANLSPSDTVVEIGPGRGFLTRSLSKFAGRLVAVELDESLATSLRDKLDGCANITVITADAREIDINTLVEPKSTYKVVANLPYYAATPIIRRFLEASNKPSLMVVMVQREVAQEMAAAPGKMRLLSVATQLYGAPKIITYVPAKAFRPAPRVTSAVVRIDVYRDIQLPIDSEKTFLDLVRSGFSAPRKQLKNSLALGLELTPTEVAEKLSAASIDPSRRAQTLSLSEWSRLHKSFSIHHC